MTPFLAPAGILEDSETQDLIMSFFHGVRLYASRCWKTKLRRGIRNDMKDGRRSGSVDGCVKEVTRRPVVVGCTSTPEC